MDAYLMEISQFLRVKDIFRFACTRRSLYGAVFSQECAARLSTRRPDLREMYAKIDFSSISVDERPGFLFRLLALFDSGTGLWLEMYDTLVSRDFEVRSPDPSTESVLEQLFSDHQLVLPPDVVLMLKSARIGRYPNGLRFPDIEYRRYWYRDYDCRNIVRIAELHNGFGDGATVLFVIAEPAHVWYGRCIWYIRRTDFKFHALCDCYSFSQVLHFLVCKQGLRPHYVFHKSCYPNAETIEPDELLISFQCLQQRWRSANTN